MDADSKYEGRRPYKGAARTAIHEIRTVIAPCRRSGQAVNPLQPILGGCVGNPGIPYSQQALLSDIQLCQDIDRDTRQEFSTARISLSPLASQQH